MRILDRRRAGMAAMAALTWVSLATRVSAAPALVGGGGYDFYSGPGQSTRSAMAIVGAEAAPGNATLAFMRWSDSVAGEGNGAMLGVGVQMVPTCAMRAWVTRFVGDETLRSWRIKAGPLVDFAGGRNAGLYYTHARDDAGFRSDGVAAELAIPFGAQVTGRAGAAWADASGGVQATQGTLGLGVSPVHGLELTAEGGVAYNGAFLVSSGPTRRPLLPILGGGGGADRTEPARMDPILLLGVRVLLP